MIVGADRDRNSDRRGHNARDHQRIGQESPETTATARLLAEHHIIAVHDQDTRFGGRRGSPRGPQSVDSMARDRGDFVRAAAEPFDREIAVFARLRGHDRLVLIPQSYGNALQCGTLRIDHLANQDTAVTKCHIGDHRLGRCIRSPNYLRYANTQSSHRNHSRFQPSHL